MMTNAQLVEKFQCPGCVAGSNTRCGVYQADTDAGGVRCVSHVLGTIVMPIGNIALGLPKGFCRPGVNWETDPPRSKSRIKVRLWKAGTDPGWDQYNVAVWALEREGFLYVRTYLPRVNDAFVDVIEKGTLALVPSAMNVADFYEEFD